MATRKRFSLSFDDPSTELCHLQMTRCTWTRSIRESEVKMRSRSSVVLRARMMVVTLSVAVTGVIDLASVAAYTHVESAVVLSLVDIEFDISLIPSTFWMTMMVVEECNLLATSCSLSIVSKYSRSPWCI